MILRGSYVEWTTLRRRKNRVEVLAQDRADADLQEPLIPGNEDQASQIYRSCPALTGEFSLGLPSAQVMLRVVELPDADPEDLASMVELQVDKFVPFQVDRIESGWEVLRKNGSSLRVLVAAVLREHVEHLGQPFLLHHKTPTRVDVEVLGWWQLLKDSGEVQEVGRQAFLLLEPGGVELIISQEGEAVRLQNLGAISADPEEAATQIAEELVYTLTTLEAEWGGVIASRLHVWHWREEGDVLLSSLRASSDLEWVEHRFSDLPPLSEGLARRLLEHPEGLNLRPEVWKAASATRRFRRRLITATVILLTLWVLGMASLWILSRVEGPRYASRLAEVTRLEESASVVSQMQKRLDALEQYADRTYSSLECLRESTLILPQGVELNRFSYEKEKGIKLEGEAPSADRVYDYVAALERSDLFTEVNTGRINDRRRPNGSLFVRFDLEAMLPEGDEP